jgi:hypothetical protein
MLEPLPVQIRSVSPTAGEEMVNVNRELRIEFSDEIDPATLTSQAIDVSALNVSIPGRVVPNTMNNSLLFYPDTGWPESTTVRVTIDGAHLRDMDGNPIDADGDLLPGGVGVIDFSTLPLTFIPGTVVKGRI